MIELLLLTLSNYKLSQDYFDTCPRVGLVESDLLFFNYFKMADIVMKSIDRFRAIRQKLCLIRGQSPSAAVWRIGRT